MMYPHLEMVHISHSIFANGDFDLQTIWWVNHRNTFILLYYISSKFTKCCTCLYPHLEMVQISPSTFANGASCMMSPNGSRFVPHSQKLRRATYMAAVCKFRGGYFFVGLVPSVHSSAQHFINCLVFLLQLILVAFVQLIHINDLLDNVTFQLLTN